MDQTAHLGSSRTTIMKTMKEHKGGPSAGRKANPRAMDMAMSGRNKA